MSLDWPTAALRSFAVSLRAGRPASLRILLCRHRTAARTTSRFSAVGITSVLVHGTAATTALTGFLAAAEALTGFLAPRATLALTFVSRLCAASAVGEAMRRPAMS